MIIVFRSVRHILFDQFNVQWTIRKVLFVMVPWFIGIAQVRNLKVLLPFSTAGNLMTITAFVLTMYLMLTGSEKDFGEQTKFESLKFIPNFVCMAMFALDGWIGAVMPIANSMENPHHFLGCPGVLNTVMTILIVMNLLMGFLGYATYGDEILEFVSLNLRGNQV